MESKIRAFWQLIQDLVDIQGGTIMAIMSCAFIFRVIYTAFGHPGLNASEAAMYASAIGSLAYSNGGPKQS